MSADVKTIANLFLEQAKDLWIFYLGAVAFGAFIKTFRWDRRIRASLIRFGNASIVVATAAALVSPLCSCGILPVVIALSAAGVPLAPVLSLLITSPLMSPDAFMITVGQLGWRYALWKFAVAATVGLAAGFAALWLVRRGLLEESNLRAEKMYAEGESVRPGYREILAAGCFAHATESGGVVDRESRFVFFLERFRDMALLVGKFLVLALLVQAVVTYYVPTNAIEPLLGRKSVLSVVFATLVAIPLPLHQVAAPSLVKGLLATGMSPGAGMAMLIGGPVTSIPALSALLGVYDRRAFVLYFAIAVAAALGSGFLFRAFYG